MAAGGTAVTALRTHRRIAVGLPRRPAARGDAIVVFGAQVHGGRPSAELRARLRHAAALWSDGWAPVVVCSGGAAEAAAMAAWLADRVPAEALVVDPAGVSTRATLAAAHGRGRLLLVSSPYHAYRIAAEARRQGLDAEVCPAPGCPLEADPAARRRQRARELAASWWYAAVPVRR
jgi:uncharacterized SAM-binding protein YcdF (DUF218 family)